MKVFDNVVKDFSLFNRQVRMVDYTGEVNPVDGVEYPDISTAIPPKLLAQVQCAVATELNSAVTFNTKFLRMTNANTNTAPHQSHNDISMGEYTFLMYFQDGPGGTDLVQHKETGCRDGSHTEECQRDTNEYDAWEVVESVKMKANRGILFPSQYLHRAEPVEGFGEDTSDGRIVLVVFLSRDK